jgi:hypothetical protein
MTERKEVPNFDTVSDTPKTGDRVHFDRCVWTLVVTNGRVTTQEVPTDKFSYTLEGFRHRMSEVLTSITSIEPVSRS